MGKKTKVVIDTNVIISAFGWHGAPQNIVWMMANGKIQNFISLEMLGELKRVASYPKLGFPEGLQAEILETIYHASSIVSSTTPVHIVHKDPNDNMILECAAAGKVEYIITGDKHLLELGCFGTITILTPDDFLQRWSTKK